MSLSKPLRSKNFVKRNFARQGKSSEGNEAVDIYGNLTESQIDNPSVATSCATFPYTGTAKLSLSKPLRSKFVTRNFARQGKSSAKPDGIFTYVEGDKSQI